MLLKELGPWPPSINDEQLVPEWGDVAPVLFRLISLSAPADCTSSVVGLFIPFEAAARRRLIEAHIVTPPRSARATDIRDNIDSTRIFPAAFSAASKSLPKLFGRLAAIAARSVAGRSVLPSAATG